MAGVSVGHGLVFVPGPGECHRNIIGRILSLTLQCSGRRRKRGRNVPGGAEERTTIDPVSGIKWDGYAFGKKPDVEEEDGEAYSDVKLEITGTVVMPFSGEDAWRNGSHGVGEGWSGLAGRR